MIINKNVFSYFAHMMANRFQFGKRPLMPDELLSIVETKEQTQCIKRQIFKGLSSPSKNLAASFNTTC
tara:strand:- start:169 stop:372 length:204 start_codon:yes stop_codon:yes gene_type:complete